MQIYMTLERWSEKLLLAPMYCEFSLEFSCSVVSDRDHMDCSMPGFPVCHQLLELAQIHVYQVSDAIQPSNPLLYPFLPAFNLSQYQGLFQWVISLHQVAKVLECQLQHQSFQSVLISFRIDWLDPCSPRDSQESSQTPQFKSISSSLLSLLYVQLSHPYVTTGKTTALTIWTFVGKVISLLFNMLSRLVIAFLPRNKL